MLVNAARTHQAKVRSMAGVRAKPKTAAKKKR
jgi:4-hydroxy-2-oxoheptanedioate aldolase